MLQGRRKISIYAIIGLMLLSLGCQPGGSNSNVADKGSGPAGDVDDSLDPLVGLDCSQLSASTEADPRIISMKNGSLGYMAVPETAYKRSATAEFFDTPGYQSPVSFRGGEVINLAGEGLSRVEKVVYIKHVPGQSLSPPQLPELDANESDSGYAEIISRAGDSNISIVMPDSVSGGDVYAVWGLDREGGWVGPVVLNAAFPMWFVPAEVDHFYSPQVIRIAGRNLDVGTDSVRCVRLSNGSDEFIIDALAPIEKSANYLVEFVLPKGIPLGQYYIDVLVNSRGWVRIGDDSLLVKKSSSSPIFSVTDYGCSGQDNTSDIGCIRNAIRDAQKAGGGDVYFPPGDWYLRDPKNEIWSDYTDGIIVPEGVGLVGDGDGLSRIIQGEKWVLIGSALFTLLGSNRVEGLWFKRESKLASSLSYQISALRIGNKLSGSGAQDVSSQVVRSIQIRNCRFSDVDYALVSGGLGIENFTIKDNTFEAHSTAIELPGGGDGVRVKFSVKDLLIENNIFLPGSYKAARQGPIAIELGGTDRAVIISNSVNGKANGGWRAGFFWHLGGVQEKILLDHNYISCSGDSNGDGEAIAFDSNDGLYKRDVASGKFIKDSISAFDSYETVKDSTLDSVSVVSQKLIQTADGFYNGHWVFVVDGPGTGQARKIVGYERNGGIRFRVAPNWDVLPKPGKSKVVIYRSYWQVHVVSNTIDNRECNKPGEKGVISWFASFLDSSIAYNKLTSTDGILLWSLYTVNNPGTIANESSFSGVFGGEIHGNIIKGYKGKNVRAGITVSYGAERGYGPILGQSVDVSANEIKNNGESGILFTAAWWLPENPLIRTFVIQRNLIEGPKTGIHIDNENVEGVVVFKNDIRDVGSDIVDKGGNVELISP